MTPFVLFFPPFPGAFRMINKSMASPNAFLPVNLQHASNLPGTAKAPADAGALEDNKNWLLQQFR